MRTWTQEEEQLLKDVYETSTNSELAKMFPNKSSLAIYKKARKLGFYKSANIEFKNRSEARKIPDDLHKKQTTSKGYVTVYRPDHPRASKNGRVMEHIIVFEEATGISVPKNCAIHHLNGKKDDNRIENLCLMEHGAHTTLHHRGYVPSDDCRRLVGEKTKARLSDPRNHPRWKEINIDAMKIEVENGASVKDTCKKYGINKSTYYKRLRRKNES